MLNITNEYKADTRITIGAEHFPPVNESYITHWQAWEKQASAGEGELRDIAVARLLECLSSGKSVLDLSHLNLHSLPDLFPPQLTSLKLTGNPSMCLPNNLPSFEIIVEKLSCEASPLLSGHEIRVMAEEINDLQSRVEFQPKISATGAAIVVGATLLAGAGSWFYYRTSNHHTPEDTADQYALSPGVNALVAASPLPVYRSTTQSFTEQELVNALRQQNSTRMTREELAVSVAGLLFPGGKVWEPEAEIIKLARPLLQSRGYYGGNENEACSVRMAKNVVCDWMIQTLLGSAPREYVADRIITDRLAGNAILTTSDYLWPMLLLQPDDMLAIDTIEAAKRPAIRAMWHQYIRENLPVLAGTFFNNAVSLSFTDYEFLSLCTGVEYLSAQGKMDEFSPQEATDIGAAIWRQVLSGDTDVELLPYLITSSLWFAAWIEPETVQVALMRPEKDYAQTVVPLVITYWQEALEQLGKVEGAFDHYQTELKAWSSKGGLATKLLANCTIEEITIPTEEGNIIINPDDTEENVRYREREYYLLHDYSHCNKLPPLTEEYRRLTSNVVDAYRELDEILITGALTVVDKKELDFILSDGVVIHPASLDMRTHVAREPKIGKQNIPDVIIGLDNTLLFSATKNDEERIYGLKRGGDKYQEYAFYRLDRDVGLYIKHRVLTHKVLWKDYFRGTQELAANGYRITFNIDVNKIVSLSPHKGTEQQDITEWLSGQYREAYYARLYHEGNDKALLEEIWDIVKLFVPFYTCLEGVTSGERKQTIEALPDCVLSALVFIPAIGQSIKLGGKFGQSVMRGIRSGVLKATQGASPASVSRTVLQSVVLPGAAEFQPLLKSTLRALDPGVELLFRGGVQTVRIISGIKNPQLAEKLRRIMPIKSKPQISSYKQARLSEYGPVVSVKKVGEDSWVAVNTETGETSGKKYFLVTNTQKQTDVMYHRPGEAIASESDSSSSDLGPALVPGSNNLPTVMGKAAYWNAVRGAMKEPVVDILVEAKNSGIQKMKVFLPEMPIFIRDLNGINKRMERRLTELFGRNPWFAYAGVVQDSALAVPPYITELRAELSIHVRQSIKTLHKVKEMLWSLNGDSQLLTSEVGKYLSDMLETARLDVLQQAYFRLTAIVDRATSFLTAAERVDFSNFMIISTKLIPAPNYALKYRSPMATFELAKLPFATVVPHDPEARVYIFADRYKRNDLKEGKNTAGNKLSDVITHEVTHLSSQTFDMFSMFYPGTGRQHSGLDIRETIFRYFDVKEAGKKIPIIFKQKHFNEFINRLKIQQGIKNYINEDSIINAIYADDMLIANLMMSDAEVITTIVRDLAAHFPFDAKIRTARDVDVSSENSPNSTTPDSGDPFDFDMISLAVLQGLGLGAIFN
ncbi:hypothetical protein ACQYRI_06950 [Salmonella enterica]